MGTMANLGYISAAANYNCGSPSIGLIIQAGANALYPVLLSAVSFSCLDIIKMRAGISPWHARGMRALINGAIPPDQSDTVNKIYKFTIPLQKALFFFFVVDLTTQFFARWQSQIFKLAPCQNIPTDCNWTGKDPAWAIGAAGSESYVAYFTDTISGDCRVRPALDFYVPQGHFWSAYFGMQVKPILKEFPVNNVTTWIMEITGSFYKFKPQIAQPGWIGNDIDAIYQKQGQERRVGGNLYRFMATADNPAVAVSGSAAVTTSATPIYNNGIIPVNCFGNNAPSAGSP